MPDHAPDDPDHPAGGDAPAAGGDSPTAGGRPTPPPDRPDVDALLGTAAALRGEWTATPVGGRHPADGDGGGAAGAPPPGRGGRLLDRPAVAWRPDRARHPPDALALAADPSGARVEVAVDTPGGRRSIRPRARRVAPDGTATDWVPLDADEVPPGSRAVLRAAGRPVADR